MDKEITHEEVSGKTKHSGETAIRCRVGAEPCVWTESMLRALKLGVKGGKWFSLKDKIYSEQTLLCAWKKVRSKKGSCGIDKISLTHFEKHLETNLSKLQNELRSGRYKPRAVKRVYIPKAGSSEKRPLGIPTVKDRIVQTALLIVIGPIFENEFADCSYGFRPNRSCKDALREVDNHLKEGFQWIVDADLKGYFDTIDHDLLMNLVKEKISDALVLKLIESYLKQGVIEGFKGWQPTESGTPQGAVISPLLANLFLNKFDHLITELGYKIVRYADDFVVLCSSKGNAQECFECVKLWMTEHKLTIHPNKSKIAYYAEGFEFLGYLFKGGRRYVRDKSVRKLRSSIKPITKRTSGLSMQSIVERINPILKGWFNYFKHADKSDHKSVDGYVRGRLRSILRRRQKKRGRARGSDHQRWPNKYFAKMGLFSLEEARQVASQSR